MSHVVETGQPSVGRLLKELTTETADLLQKEIALAKTEVSEKLAHLGRNAAGVGIAAAVLLLAGLALLLAVIAGVTVLLDQFLPLALAVWLGPLIVAAGLGGFGWRKLQRGLEAIKVEGLAPRETVETLKEARQWISAKAS
jgi:uncharacterized membrane protein YqjE